MVDLLVIRIGSAVVELFALLLLGWIFNLPASWLHFCVGFALGEFLVVLAWLWLKTLEQKPTE